MLTYPNGPWKTLFTGNFDTYNLSIYINQNGYILTEILNDDNTKAITSINLILGVEGDAEGFIETMPKAGNFIMLHNEKDTFKFLFMTQIAELINTDDAEARDLCTKQTNILEKNSKIIKDIAKSYDLKLIDYTNIAEIAKKTLFTNPIVFATLLKEAKITTLVSMPKEIAKPKGQSINLGWHKATNEPSFEPIEYFDKTLIISGKQDSIKNQLTSIISEEMSFNDINVLLFSYSENAENLKFPNPNSELITKKLDADPIGFPTALYNISKDGIFCDLSELPIEGLNELYNIGNNTVSEIIKTAMQKKPKTMEQLYDIIGQITPTETITKYDLFLAQRVVDIIKQMHPELYLGQQDTGFITKAWKKMGKINIVVLDEKDKIKNKVVIHNLLKKLIRDETKIAICLPMAHQYLDRSENDALDKELLNLSLQDKNKYFVLYTPNAIDINDKIASEFKTVIQITEDNDVAIKLKEAKPYRIELRPTFSKSE